MKKILVVLLLLSFNCFADDYTENAYRRVFTGFDYLEHEYLVVSDDAQTKIYSMTPLFTKNNKVSSIILNPDDFQRMISEFTKK